MGNGKIPHFGRKYEQTVNKPKITLKKAFFRIFWKILAKTGPQTLYSCGFPEASVEMKVAPFRALTLGGPGSYIIFFYCGNEGRPIQGIDTVSGIVCVEFCIVEMKVAPFRALTQYQPYDRGI